MEHSNLGYCLFDQNNAKDKSTYIVHTSFKMYGVLMHPFFIKIKRNVHKSKLWKFQLIAIVSLKGLWSGILAHYIFVSSNKYWVFVK